MYNTNLTKITTISTPDPTRDDCWHLALSFPFQTSQDHLKIAPGQIQVVQSKAPRWTEAVDQINSYLCLLNREVQEVFTTHILDRLKLKFFLELMNTCKEMYNYCIKFLPLKAVIPTTLNNIYRNNNHFLLKFCEKNNISTKLNIPLSVLQSSSLPLKICATNPSLTLSIKNATELTQLSLLLKSNRFSKNQLYILDHIVGLSFKLWPSGRSHFLPCQQLKSLLDIDHQIFRQLKSLSLPSIIQDENLLSPDLFSKLFIKTLSLHCGTHPRFSQWPPLLETLCFTNIMVTLDLSILPPLLENLYLIDVSGNQDLSKLTANLKTLSIESMDNTHLLTFNIVKLPPNLQNFSIKIGKDSYPSFNLPHLPTSLETFSMNQAVRDCHFTRGNSIICIQKGCIDIEIRFIPILKITSSDNTKIRVTHTSIENPEII